jgi:hypothetical protein
MGKKTLTILECDFPDCEVDETTDVIKWCQLKVGDGEVKRPHLCTEHRALPFEGLYEKVSGTPRRRRRGVQVVRPEDIPRTGTK